jgi:hypothetical protein
MGLRITRSFPAPKNRRNCILHRSGRYANAAGIFIRPSIAEMSNADARGRNKR